MNHWDTISAALDEHNRVQNAIRYHATRIARCLIGNLRNVENGSYLAQLKKELENFDSRTKEWKP